MALSGEMRTRSDAFGRRRAMLGRVAVLGGLVVLAGCGQDDHPATSALITCDPPALADFSGSWRLTLPSTVTGSTFIHCTEPASDGTAVTVPTEVPCPEDPTSPCPVELTFSVTVFVKEYHPGGVPLYGIVGSTDAGQVLFGEIESGACTASFRFGQSGDVHFGCSGTFADSHREMFASCLEGEPPGGVSEKDRACDVSPPIEPLVEFLPPEPAT
jgi:hypothetical protein